MIEHFGQALWDIASNLGGGSATKRYSIDPLSSNTMKNPADEYLYNHMGEILDRTRAETRKRTEMMQKQYEKLNTMTDPRQKERIIRSLEMYQPASYEDYKASGAKGSFAKYRTDYDDDYVKNSLGRNRSKHVSGFSGILPHVTDEQGVLRAMLGSQTKLYDATTKMTTWHQIVAKRTADSLDLQKKLGTSSRESINHMVEALQTGRMNRGGGGGGLGAAVGGLLGGLAGTALGGPIGAELGSMAGSAIGGKASQESSPLGWYLRTAMLGVGTGGIYNLYQAATTLLPLAEGFKQVSDSLQAKKDSYTVGSQNLLTQYKYRSAIAQYLEGIGGLNPLMTEAIFGLDAKTMLGGGVLDPSILKGGMAKIFSQNPNLADKFKGLINSDDSTLRSTQVGLGLLEISALNYQANAGNGINVDPESLGSAEQGTLSRRMGNHSAIMSPAIQPHDIRSPRGAGNPDKKLIYESKILLERWMNEEAIPAMANEIDRQVGAHPGHFHRSHNRTTVFIDN